METNTSRMVILNEIIIFGNEKPSNISDEG